MLDALVETPDALTETPEEFTAMLDALVEMPEEFIAMFEALVLIPATWPSNVEIRASWAFDSATNVAKFAFTSSASATVPLMNVFGIEIVAA
jgi:hypothetical protein